LLDGGVVESVLLAQDRLAAARRADDQVDGVAQQPSIEDLIEGLVPA